MLQSVYNVMCAVVALRVSLNASVASCHIDIACRPHESVYFIILFSVSVKNKPDDQLNRTVFSFDKKVVKFVFQPLTHQF